MDFFLMTLGLFFLLLAGLVLSFWLIDRTTR